MRPDSFDCAIAHAWVGKDRKLWNALYDPDALLVGTAGEVPDDVEAAPPVIYCVDVEAELKGWLMISLTGPIG